MTGVGFDFQESNNYEPINDFYNTNIYLSEYNNNFEFLNDEKISNEEFLSNKDIKSSQKMSHFQDFKNDQNFVTFNINSCNNYTTNHTTCDNIPSYIPLENCKDNLLSQIINKDILDILIPGKNTKKCYNFINQINENNNNKYFFNISKKNGRKFDLDEIVLKIKSNIIKLIFKFINSLIKNINNKNNKLDLLLPLKYELISRPMDKLFNLKLLNQPIYKILSNDISGQNPKKNYLIINYIINSINKEYLIIKKALELTWGDYLDIFRYNYTQKLEEKMGKNLFDEIKNQFDKIDNFICELYVKMDENENEKNDYLSSVLLLTYNYERYFMIKKIRNKNTNKK